MDMYIGMATRTQITLILYNCTKLTYIHLILLYKIYHHLHIFVNIKK